jgi:hypothetical protein
VIKIADSPADHQIPIWWLGTFDGETRADSGFKIGGYSHTSDLATAKKNLQKAFFSHGTEI